MEELVEPGPVEEVNAFIHSLFSREVTEDELAAFLVHQPAGALPAFEASRGR